MVCEGICCATVEIGVCVCVCVLFDSIFTFSLWFSESLSVHMTCSVQFSLSCVLIDIYNVQLDRSVT